MPELKLSGAYRPLMVKPYNFKWQTVTYQNHTDQINVTDQEKVKDDATGNVRSFDGDKTAVVLEFQLPSCCYASVLVWELSK